MCFQANPYSQLTSILMAQNLQPVAKVRPSLFWTGGVHFTLGRHTNLYHTEDVHMRATFKSFVLLYFLQGRILAR